MTSIHFGGDEVNYLPDRKPVVTMSNGPPIMVVNDMGRIDLLIGDWRASSIGGLSHAHRETAYCCTAVVLRIPS